MSYSDQVPQSEWRRGWPVVFAASAGYGLSGGLFSITAGLFINPMRQEFGWTMSQVAIAPYVHLLIALMMPVGGIVINKVGPRPVALFGILLFATGYIALATLPLSLLLLYAIVGCLGIFGPSGNAGPYARVVATWFQRHVGMALGVTTAGTSFAGLFVLPIVAAAIARWGWRGGYLTLAALLTCFALPILLLLLRERKQTEASQPTAPPARSTSLVEALANPHFWLLLLAIGLAAIPVGVYLTHLQPILQNAGFSLETGAAFGSLFAFAVGVGRIGGGMLVDRFWSFGVAAAAVGLGALGCLIVTAVTPATTFALTALAIVLIGLAYGGEIDFGAYFTLKLFGIGSFDRIFGWVALIMGAAIAAGGIIGSTLFDMMNSYRFLGPITALCFALSSGAFLILGMVMRKTVAIPAH
ncbi:MFS transporter [Sphingobium mellinum]|uniref:MFS transporter n=1 Tax=Sphingobium mellinum TaxID=1387166 RepID=UPI0030ED9B29